jgi:serine protease Do
MNFQNFSKKTQLIFGVTLLITAFFVGYAFKSRSVLNEDSASPISIAPSPISETHALNGLPDFSSIVVDQGPAVVNISVSGFKKMLAHPMPGFSSDPNDSFYDFFKRFQPQAPESGMPTQGLGSGFIVKANGLILTNAHVVSDADEVKVKLTDKREFKAKVVGIDKASDVAVLKIAASNLPTVKFGDPQKSRVGEWVLAIGAPFGFENSATVGVISAKSRSLPDESYVPFIQTDVAINPGNSGGPLFNLQGEVIGINSQIYSQSGGYQGLSFAIPIDVALKVEEQLIDHGKVSRGRLGVGIQSITQDLASSFGLDKPTGALVIEVERGSPAENAGIKVGDVILKFNGKAIEKSQDLPPMVADTVPGNEAKIEIWHDNKSQIVTIKVGEIKTSQPIAHDERPSRSKLGLMLRPLTDGEKKQADVNSGLLVEQVLDGPAAKSGIMEGDLILSVNGHAVSQVEELRKQLEKTPKTALLVKRRESKLFVAIKES